MKTTIRQATDGRRLVVVEMERQSADADAPTIEAVFLLRFPDDYTITDATASVLMPLSVTRTDTREAVDLDRDEEETILRAAINKAAATEP